MVNDIQYFPIAIDPSSKKMLEIACRVAASNATVLLTGETGVGKELLARFIHQHSSCSTGPFISINCAALPENMIEAILFGYEKGAFTGAVNSHTGKFEQAQNGTLLLDEISELPIELQAKLLRALQEREIERLCGKKSIKINARIIAATNRDLKQQIDFGLFRKDLFYRLNVLPIHCVALRERPLDILPLAEYFLDKYAILFNRSKPKLTELAQKKLIHYVWPGNVREMENAIQRALIMALSDTMDEKDIVLQENSDEHNTLENIDHFSSKLKASEAQIIIDVLKEAQGQRNVAAKKLNMSPRTLRHKISKLKSVGVKIP